MSPSRTRYEELVRTIARRFFYEDRCMQIASSLTFTALLALVPIVTVALTVITAFPVFGEMTAALQTFLLDNMIPESADAVFEYTQKFTRNAAKLTAVGIVFLIVTSVMLLLTIDRAFNDIWRVKRPRPIVQRVLVYWTLLTVGPVLIGASLSLTSWLVGQAVGLVHSVPGAGRVLLTIVPIVLTATAFSLLYVAMPNRRIRVKDALIGGLLAAIGFEVMKRGFALYVAQFPTYTLVYGAFATVPIFLLWIYISWLVVIFGAVVVAALPDWRDGAGAGTPMPGSDLFDALQILKTLWRAHRTGSAVTMPEIVSVTAVRIEQVEEILDTMVSAGWVSRTMQGGWVLQRDPATITVEDIYRLFVFRADTRRPAKGADPELDQRVHELGARMSENLQVTLDKFFAEGEDEATLHAEAAVAAAKPGLQSVVSR